MLPADSGETMVWRGLAIVQQFVAILRRLMKRVDIDRAVLLAILARLWGLVAGPVTALLITTKFTPEVQGYHYTFASLVALQGFVELGLGTVIIQFASHEWSRLGLDREGRIIGDPQALSRLVSLASFALKWFLSGSIIVTLGLGISGYVFFLQSPVTSVDWTMPWFTLCLLTGASLLLVPLGALLEGCNQVSSVYTYRFLQGLCTSLSVWLAILSNANLWTASVSSAVGLVCFGVLLRWRYWDFLKTLLFSRATGLRIGWRSEILPMQWRMALSGLAGYFVFYFFTPVLFQYHGAVVAGQMGMTLTLVNILSSMPAAWVFPRAPLFGILIARREYAELDKLFWRLTKTVVAVTSLGAAAIWTLVYALYALGHPLATRILPPLPTGLFLLATVFYAASLPMSSYLRAHRQEPLMFLSVVSGILVALSNLVLGRYYSATGMAVGYLSVTVIVIPLIAVVWYRCRAAWHT